MAKLKNFRIFVYPTSRKARKMERVRSRSRSSYETRYIEFTRDYEEIYKALSPNRITILFLLRYRKRLTISQISQEVGRDYKNVYNDIKRLERWGFVEKEKKNGKVFVRATVSSITVKLFFAPDEEREPLFCWSSMPRWDFGL